ncbi:extracellular calcium-sensing receptor [Hydra vulgaris]|uniref:extracellular calcium-sensing receptor n=1 Tax=Hydra vulgaris TaxID=6087 RepID=UPI001F5EE89C|nr:extracellular calcium-sensing receptor [Hydra vulgaris]
MSPFWKIFALYFLTNTQYICCEYVMDYAGCIHKQEFYNLNNSTYFIGGIVPAHRTKDRQTILNYPGIYWASTIAHTIREINMNKELLPHIQLGYDIRDSNNLVHCSEAHALDFLLDKSWNSTLLGVVGPASSSLSAAVSAIFLPDFIPVVSYSSTSTELSVRFKYRNFLRTAPTDAFQALAIIDLLKHFGWTYVSLLASSDGYGYFGKQEIKKIAKEKNICFSVDEIFEEDIGKVELKRVVGLLKQLNEVDKVVILWCSVDDAIKIINKTMKYGLENITWIGTEQWASSSEIIQLSNNNLSHNIFLLRLQHENIYNLEEDIWNEKKSSDINCQNPWYHEFLSSNSITDCQFSGSVVKKLPNKKQAQVVAAVYALARGLHFYLNCTNTECLEKPGKLDYEALYKQVLKTKFNVPKSNFSIEFNEFGEIVSPVYEFAKVINNSFKKFGSWNVNLTSIDNPLIDWSNNRIPLAVCGIDCQPGKYRINSSRCCWICEICPINTVSSGVNQYSCVQCSATSIMNKNRTRCIDLLEIRLHIKNSLGLFISIGSAFGVICSLFVLVLFIIYWDTPLVKSSNREMSAIQLISIIALFCLSFFYYFELTPRLCMIRTLYFGFFFTTVVALVCLKTYRLLRVFNGRFTKVSRFLENKYQIIFSFLIVLLQSLASFLWFIYFPEKIVITTYPKELKFCRSCGHEAFWGIFIYIFIFVILNGYMAFRARKLPENFNEAQRIAYAMFTVFILWLTYIPLYVSLGPNERNIAFLCINLAVSFSSLLILYWTKVIIILFHPNLNSRQSFRNAAEKSVMRNFLKDVKPLEGSPGNSTVTFNDQLFQPRKFSLPCFDSTDYNNLKEGFPLRRSFSQTSTNHLDYDTFPVTIVNNSSKEMNSYKDERVKKSPSQPLLREDSREQLSRPKSQLFFNKGMMSAAASLHSLSSFLTAQNPDDKEESKGLLNESQM